MEVEVTSAQSLAYVKFQKFHTFTIWKKAICPIVKGESANEVVRKIPSTASYIKEVEYF